MKKISKYLIYTIITLLGFIGVVYAAECSAVEMNEIKSKASNIRINYVTGVRDVEAKEHDGREVALLSRYIDIKIYNITSDIFIRVKSSGDNATIEDQLVDYHNLGPDDSITLRIPALDVVTEYTFEVLSYSGNCRGDIIRTIRLTIPKYNFYSQLAVCNDAKDFYLCQEYITFDVDKARFTELVNNYLEKGGADSDVLINQANALNKIVSPSTKTRYFIVGALIIGGIAATFFIVKKNRKKEKLW